MAYCSRIKPSLIPYTLASSSDTKLSNASVSVFIFHVTLINLESLNTCQLIKQAENYFFRPFPSLFFFFALFEEGGEDSGIALPAATNWVT